MTASTSFDFDAYSPQVASDPFPLYQTMRDEHPLAWCESTRAWALSRYDDVLAALRDTDTFSSANGNVVNDNPGRAGRTLGTTDPPRHDALRKLVDRAFARRTVEEYEPSIRMLTEALLAEALANGGVVDLRSAIAFPSSAAVIGDVLGVDIAMHGELASAFSVVLDEPPRLGVVDDDPRRARAGATVFGLVTETIALRRANPGEDVVSALIEAGLTDEDIVWIIVTFLGAGLESSTSQFLLGALALARQPDVRRRMAKDPSLIPNAYEELVRFDSATARFHRTATRDVVLHGETIEAGDSVLVLYASANRDPRRFDRADDLLIDRYPNRHLGFGRGSHFCLGAPLARLQGRILFESLLAVAPDYAVAGDLQWKINPGFRGVKALPVALIDSEV
jgi:cytochrome P450